MTTIEKYVCDICDKTFDNKNECIEHEFLERFDKFLGKAIFFDETKEIIPIHTLVKEDFEVQAILIKDAEVIPLIIDLFEYRSIIEPWSSDGGCNKREEGLFLYDYNTYCWYRPADRIKELKEEMKEYEVDV